MAIEVIVLDKDVCACGRDRVLLSHPINAWRHADGDPVCYRLDADGGSDEWSKQTQMEIPALRAAYINKWFGWRIEHGPR